jgi:acetyl esterase/lipase
MRFAAKAMLGLAALALTAAPLGGAPIMTPDDLGPLAQVPAGEKIAYGPAPSQYGELVLPKGKGPHPVLIWMHGGCWLSQIDIAHSHALARAMADEGFAVWNVEYRRLGEAGSGWPGTFADVAAAADHVRRLAKVYDLDFGKVIAGGHSAGGQLALWLAARPKLPRSSALWTAQPLRIRGVLALAPATGLTALLTRPSCGGVEKLMGGTPQQVPDRYNQVEPDRLAPIGVPQSIILGAHDGDFAWLGAAYADAARKAGDGRFLSVIKAPDAGHFELINPGSSTWPLVRAELRKLKKGL